MISKFKELLVARFGKDLCNHIVHAIYTAGGIDEFDCESDGFALISSTGKFLIANAPLYEILGIENTGQLDNQCWQKYCRSSQVQFFLKNSAPDFAASGVWWGRVKAQHSSGHEIALNLSLVRLETGQTVCLVRTEEAQAARTMREGQYPDMWAAYGAATKQQLARSIGHDFANLIAVMSGSIEEAASSTHIQDVSGVRFDLLELALVEARRMVADLQNFPRSNERPRCRDVMSFGPMLKRALFDRTGAECDFTLEQPETPQFVWSTSSDFLIALTTILELIFRAHPEAKVLARADTLTKGFDPVDGFLSKNVSYTEIAIQFALPTHANDLRTIFSDGGHSWALSGMDSVIFAGLLRDNQAAQSFRDLGELGQEVTLVWPNKPALSWTDVEQVCLEPSCNLEDCCILVVDDSPLMSDLLSKILDDTGASTLAVSKPEEALRLVEQSPHIWSAVITDLDMPNLNGLELTKKMRAISQSLPVILVSGQAHDFAVDITPFSAVLSKPVVPSQLVATVSAQVARAINGKSC